MKYTRQTIKKIINITDFIFKVPRVNFNNNNRVNLETNENLELELYVNY